MSNRTKSAAVLAVILAFCLAGTLRAQSLADVARQERARKGEAAPESGKVYTNSDIPQPALSGAESGTSAPDTQGSANSASATPPASSAKKPAASEEKPPADLEKQYRDKFASLHQNLDLEQRKLDVMQRELNMMQEQYYPDPTVALQQQYSRADIDKKTADIETQKVVVQKAQQAISDLEDELRQKGLPPGWAR